MCGALARRSFDDHEGPRGGQAGRARRVGGVQARGAGRRRRPRAADRARRDRPAVRGAQGDGHQGHAARGKRALGVMGPVPPRVDARVKVGLLDLVDGAVEDGWPLARACGVLELDERRCRRWRARHAVGGGLDDGAPGRAVHGLTPAEIDAVVDVFDRFGDIDRSYRKLAHRGSYERLVWVSESSMYRVLADQGLVLPAPPPRAPTAAPSPIPDWAEWRPGQIWIYDFTHFTRADRVA